MEREKVMITRKELELLRAKHKKAVERNQTTFHFKERTFNTRYAGYLIQYLDGSFNGLPLGTGHDLDPIAPDWDNIRKKK